MATGNRFQLIDQQTYLGQRMLNVYFYRQLSGVTNGSLILAGLFATTILPGILPIQNEGVLHTSIDVINIDNLDDYFNYPMTTDNEGTSTGDGMPPYVSWAFRYNRDSRAVRNGQKRIGGITEGNVTNGVVSGGAATDVAALANLFEDNLDTGAGDIWRPVIFHRAPATGTPPVYPPLSDGTDYAISSVQYVSVSTQNTRKFGRGI